MGADWVLNQCRIGAAWVANQGAECALRARRLGADGEFAMSSAKDIGLPEALERAATALPRDADAIRPANGDPFALLSLLDGAASQRVLAWLLAHEPAAGGELVDAWSDAGGEAAALLAQIDAEGLPKEARKALRRAHHRIRSRGESIPERAQQTIVATLPKVVDEIAVGLVSGLDPRGTRMAYLVESDPSGGARLFAAAIDEVRGVRELEVFSAGRSKIKAFVRDCTRRADYPAVEAPVDAVRAVIARAAAAQPSDAPPPRVFVEWRSHLVGSATDSPTPGALARAALVAADAEPVAAAEHAGGEGRAIALLRDQSIGPWPASNEALTEIVEKLREVADGQVVVSAAARQEQFDRVLDDAVERIFDARFARSTANRFEETAYVFWRQGALEDARACLAAADAFGASTAAFREIARAMLEVVLAPTLQSLAPRAEQSAGREGPSMVGA
jgi:hypothetical protein